MKTKAIKNTGVTTLALGAALAVVPVCNIHASADYGPAIWRPACSTHHYTSGVGKQFYVIHDMEGYYLSTISYLQGCNNTVSIHYCVNGKVDNGTDAAPGEITQMVIDTQYAWHAGCWNTHSMGTEHEGFVSNPAWFTEAMYQASAALTRSKADKYGMAKDRNHIIGHNQHLNAAWRSYASGAFGIDPNCNSHTDPGAYWDWSHYMALVGGGNPPFLFGTDSQGWSSGNSLSALAWTGTGWPGIIYADQVGNDAFYYSPPTSYTGPGAALMNVSVYPQSGSTASHDIQMFWTTAAEPYFDAAKSSPIHLYNAQNSWIRLNVNLNHPKYVGQNVTQLRLDLDNSNSSTRWIVNHVVSQSSFAWNFDANTMAWYTGNGVSPITWTAGGWPGIIYFDQTANDAFIYAATSWFDAAGPYKFLGASNDRIHVRVYPQGGNSSSHDMAVYFVTTSDVTWDEAKSVHVNYTGNDQWLDVYLNMGANGAWSSVNNTAGGVQQIRLDFDQANHGTRWIIDSVAFEHQ